LSKLLINSKFKVELIEGGIKQVTIAPNTFTRLFFTISGTLLIAFYFLMRQSGSRSSLGEDEITFFNSAYGLTLFAVFICLFFSLRYIKSRDIAAEIITLRPEGLVLKTPKKEFVIYPELLESLRLRERPGGHMLTIDYVGDRLELAADATDKQRLWLFEQIKKRYSL
jgi:hypothetical protein